MDLLGRKAQLRLEEIRLTLDRYVDLLVHYQSKVSLLEADNHGLKAQIEALKPKVVSISNQPLYMDEAEEDLKYYVENDLIDPSAAADILQQLNFDNTEITFDSYSD